MPYSYVQAGTTLHRVDASGHPTPIQLTLRQEDEGKLTLSQDRARYAVLDRRVCVVNSPSHNIMFLQGDPVKKTPDQVVSMSPVPPRRSVGLEASSLGISLGNALSGTYKYKCTFAIKDSKGRIVAESPFSDATSIELNDQFVDIVRVPISDEPSINTVRVYRTLGGGERFFHVVDIEGNDAGTHTDTLSDEAIAAAPAPTDLGNPPGSYGASTRLELLTVWKGRLFGRAGGINTAVDKDILLWSDFRRPYAWNPVNTLPIPPVGEDSFGITAFIPRRDTLGIAKRDTLYYITNPTPLSGQLRRAATIGCVAPESVVVHDDVAWFLAEDGIYQWDNESLQNVSLTNVHPWFNTDDTFNRAAFEGVVGYFNTARRAVIWLMPGKGSSVLNRWIEYYPREQIWLGPHKSESLTTTYVTYFEDEDSVETMVFGAEDGKIYQEASQGYDGDDSGPLSLREDERRRLLFNGTVTILTDLFAPIDVDANGEIFRDRYRGLWTALEGEGTGSLKKDCHIVIRSAEGFTMATAHFPWEVLDGVQGDSVSSPPVAQNSIALVASDTEDQFAVLVGKTFDGRLMLSATEEIGAVDVLVYSVDPGFDPSDVIPRADGVDMRVETQPQTADEPDMVKHFGELSLYGDVGPGHRLKVISELDGNEREHVAENEVIDRVRLNRIGDGNRMSLTIEEDSTAPTAIYGYYVDPVNVIGRR